MIPMLIASGGGSSILDSFVITFVIPMLIASGGGSSILDSSVINFVIDGIKDVISLCTVQPIGTFITIGLVGAVVGLALRLLKSVKR